jgi:hypothetical protein
MSSSPEVASRPTGGALVAAQTPVSASAAAAAASANGTSISTGMGGAGGLGHTGGLHAAASSPHLNMLATGAANLSLHQPGSPVSGYASKTSPVAPASPISSASTSNSSLPSLVPPASSAASNPVPSRKLSLQGPPPPAPPTTGRLRRRASCDLFECIDLHASINEHTARKIFSQVVSAVLYLHSRGIVHRDIKDENVVVDSEYTVKLIDFGSSALIPRDSSRYFDRFYGTLQYASPEILEGQRYRGPESEVWSLGVLLYTILYGENPFHDTRQALHADFIPPYRVSDECMNLLRRMLTREPSRRASILEVARHPWMKGMCEEPGSLSSAAPAPSTNAGGMQVVPQA